jgi:hypothetical protein
VSNPETREYVTGPGFTTRLARAQLSSALSSWTVIPAALIYIMLGVAVVRLGDEGTGWGIALAAFLLFIVLVYSGLLLWTRRNADHTSPVGTRYSATLGENTMNIAVGAVSSDLPYSAYSRVRRRGEFVLLRLRSTPQSIVLPAELLPGGDFDRLVAAVADPAAAPASKVLAGGPAAGFEWAYVTDAGYTNRLARSSTVRQFTRSGMAVVVGLLLLCGVPTLLIGLIGLLLAVTGTIPVAEIVPVFAVAAFLLGLAALAVFGTFALLRAQLRRLIPVGSIYEMGFGIEALRLRGPVNSSDLPYSSYRGARRRGQFVEITGRRGIARVVLPVQLFPGTGIDRLNSLLGGG